MTGELLSKKAVDLRYPLGRNPPILNKGELAQLGVRLQPLTSNGSRSTSNLIPRFLLSVNDSYFEGKGKSLIVFSSLP
jgi:hypothetical protein